MNYFKDKKVLVTGASGFIGTNMMIALKDLKENLRLCAHVSEIKVRQEEVFDCEMVLYSDLTDKVRCEAIVKDIDIVIHCAAVTHGAKFMVENPQGLVVDNTVMNTYLLDAAYKAGVKKFVFISSGAVYPEYIGEFEDENILINCYEAVGDVNDPPDCYFGVAHMKRYGEKLCEFYSTKVKNPMQCLVIRPSNVFGPYDDFDPDTSHVMASLIRKYCEKQNPFEVWGDGKDVRDFIYIDDFINDVLALTEKVDEFDIFNVAYGEGFSINEILNVGLCVHDISYLKGKPSTVKKRLLDVSKINKVLGKRKKTNLLDGIQKTIEWYKENKL
tara:strand:+ start:6649 stop:7635 length:987 start_codon:yes stop_codon:yes gene_type:complete